MLARRKYKATLDNYKVDGSLFVAFAHTQLFYHFRRYKYKDFVGVIWHALLISLN